MTPTRLITLACALLLAACADGWHIERRSLVEADFKTSEIFEWPNDPSHFVVRGEDGGIWMVEANVKQVVAKTKIFEGKKP